MTATAAAPHPGPVESPVEPSTSPRPHDDDARVGPGRATRTAQIAFVVVYVALFIPGFRTLTTDTLLHGIRGALSMMAYPTLFLLGCFAFRCQLAQSARRIAAHKRRAALTLLAGAVGVVALPITAGLLAQAIRTLAEVPQADLQNDTNIGAALTEFPPFLTISVLAVVGPVVEELFFRQFLIGFLERRCPTWVAVTISAVLFGTLHMSAPTLSEALNVMPHVGFGLASGILFIRSGRNIHYSATLHILTNLNGIL